MQTHYKYECENHGNIEEPQMSYGLLAHKMISKTIILKITHHKNLIIKLYSAYHNMGMRDHGICYVLNFAEPLKVLIII